MGTRLNALTSDPVPVLKYLSWAWWKPLRKSVLKLVWMDTDGMFVMWLSILYIFLFYWLEWERNSVLAIKEKMDVPQSKWFYDRLDSGHQDKLLLENEGHPLQTTEGNRLPWQLWIAATSVEAIIPQGGSSLKVRGRFSFPRQPQHQLVAQQSSSSICCLHSKRAGMARGSCGHIPLPWTAIGDPSAGWRRHCKEGREVHSHQSLCVWNTTGSGAKM